MRHAAVREETEQNTLLVGWRGIGGNAMPAVGGVGGMTIDYRCHCRLDGGWGVRICWPVDAKRKEESPRNGAGPTTTGQRVSQRVSE